MCSRCLSVLLLTALPILHAEERVLRVCSDPNNLPFSNQAGQGFENRMAELIARELSSRLEYTWISQRKSFVRNSLGAGQCDLLMGIPTSIPTVSTTRPYYRSSYVFVSRRKRDLRITSLDDPRLAQWKIGIHVVGDDYAPPGYAMARRGLAANVIGYSLFGESGEPNPPARIIDAVAAGDLDVAIVWGPFAGYFSKQQASALDIAPVSPVLFLGVPFTYEISLAVRKGETALQSELDRALAHHCAAIRSLLAEYGVPVVQPERGKEGCEATRDLSSASSH